MVKPASISTDGYNGFSCFGKTLLSSFLGLADPIQTAPNATRQSEEMEKTRDRWRDRRIEGGGYKALERRKRYRRFDRSNATQACRLTKPGAGFVILAVGRTLRTPMYHDIPSSKAVPLLPEE